jgi:Tfp pilus assembly protein PilW
MIRAFLRRLAREDGFSLTELLVVLPTLTLVLGAATMLMVTITQWNSKTTEQLTLQQTVRPTLDEMMRDLRATMPPTIGGLGLLSATGSSIVFYSPDGTAATSGTTSPFKLREIAYQFSGGALQRQIVVSTNTFTTVTSTIPWGSWTSASGNFPLATFPVAGRWTTLLGTGLSYKSRALVSSGFTYYDGEGNVIASPVSAANLGLVRTIQVDVTSTTGGTTGKTSSYSNTATIRETQPQ